MRRPVTRSSPSRPALRRAACLWVCVLVTSLATGATPMLDALPTLENISARLELTPEQEAQLRPLFEQRQSQLVQSQALLQTAATPQQQREVLREAKEAGHAFNARVEAVLSPVQKNEWRELRSELRDKARERAAQERSSR